VKTLIAQVIEEINLQQQDILHSTKLLDGNFEVVCKGAYRIKIVVSRVTKETKVMNHKECSSGSTGTQANAIVLDGDPRPLDIE